MIRRKLFMKARFLITFLVLEDNKENHKGWHFSYTCSIPDGYPPKNFPFHLPVEKDTDNPDTIKLYVSDSQYAVKIVKTERDWVHDNKSYMIIHLEDKEIDSDVLVKIKQNPHWESFPIAD
jgi:hypothetical protein